VKRIRLNKFVHTKFIFFENLPDRGKMKLFSPFREEFEEKIWVEWNWG
jgi:hypothetical protein